MYKQEANWKRFSPEIDSVKWYFTRFSKTAQKVKMFEKVSVSWPDLYWRPVGVALVKMQE